MNKRQFFFVVAFLLYLCTAPLSADTPPAEEDVNKFTRQAKQTYDDFISHTFEIRMRYEYLGGFNDPCEKEQLRKFALAAANDLDGIANNQLNLKQSIENYPKDDWEMRFGQTGLWRRSAAELLKTTLSRLEVQYYLALAFDRPGQTDILHQILTHLDTLGNLSNSPDWRLLKAKTLALLSTTEPTYKPLAKNELNIVLAQKDIPCQARFRAELEMIKLWHGLPAREDVPPGIGELADQIARTDCKSDREIILMLACLQHRFNPQSLNKTASLFPFIKNELGNLILNDMQTIFRKDISADPNLFPITAFEAELAAQSAWGNQFENSSVIIRRMAIADKFRTPRFLFIAAMSAVNDSPDEAVRFLIDASRAGQAAKDSDINVVEIAKQAAILAHKLYAETTNNCPVACEAFENYLSVADPNGDPNFSDIEYLCTSVFDSCGKENRSKELLEKIAATTGRYQNHAKLKLITQQLQQVRTVDEKHTLLAQLADLVSNIPPDGSENRDLRDEATTLYCQTLIDDANSQSAQKALDILDAAGSNPRYDFFKAQALQQIGRLEESARFMSQAIIINSGSMAPAADEIASEIINKIDLLRLNTDDFNQMLKNCANLANFAHTIINTRQSALLLAEVSVFQADIDRAENLLNPLADGNDISWLRPKARLLMAQGDFNQATLLWSKIAELRRNEPATPGQKSYNWWQAKFYELDCLAKSPKPDNQNITHTIDVLFNSFPDIPSPWAEKLNTLKQQCGSGSPAN